MKRPFALLLIFLLAIGCMPILALGAPAEEGASIPVEPEVQVAPAVAEVPESVDEAASPAPVCEDVRYLTVYPQNDPEQAITLTIYLNQDQEEPAVYVDEAQNIIFSMDEDGNTWLINMDHSAVDPQSLPEDVSPAQITSSHTHHMVNYKSTGSFYMAQDSTTCLKVTIWTRKCSVTGCTYTDTQTGAGQPMSHRFGTEKIISADHSSSINTKHTYTYSKECQNCHYISTRKANAGCTQWACNGQTQSLPPEES